MRVTYFVIKATLSGILAALVSEVARRIPELAD